MSDLTFTTRQIDGLWHMVKTENGRETAYPAGTEMHAQVMASLEATDHKRAAAGLPRFERR